MINLNHYLRVAPSPLKRSLIDTKPPLPEFLTVIFGGGVGTLGAVGTGLVLDLLGGEGFKVDFNISLCIGVKSKGRNLVSVNF